MSIDLGNGVKKEFVWISPGEFMMGSNDGYRMEKPVHKVKITKGFWMGKYPVTQEQYEQVMLSGAKSASGGGTNPSQFSGSDNPVEMVSWYDCQEFIQKLNGMVDGKWLMVNGEFRLATEAEWEYACRAGTTTNYYTGNSELDLGRAAWYDGNSGRKTHSVGLKEPNKFGLYDMHGNVIEWCQDWFDKDYYKNSPGTDPTGPNSGHGRVVRGGSWGNIAWYCRCAFRNTSNPENPNFLGFRVVVAC